MAVEKDLKDSKESHANVYNIQVAARFKPRISNTQQGQSPKQSTATTANRKIVLPLHQRLAIIRMNRQLHLQKEALRVLQEQGDWFNVQENQGSNGQENQPTQLLVGSSTWIATMAHVIWWIVPGGCESFALITSWMRHFRKPLVTKGSPCL